MDVEKLYKGKGGYVFVSHSHLDIDKVRRIRNFLEEEGMEPILFYLRCMDGSDEKKLESLKQLICDEIDSREFFLYVDSENASASKWVQEERAYIRSTRPDCITTIDLAQDEQSIQRQLAKVMKGMRVFISASKYDEPLVNKVTSALLDRDFRVYNSNDVNMAGTDWLWTTSHAIIDLAGEGFVIALLTYDSVQSRSFIEEVKTALENDVPILPVVVGQMTAYRVGEELRGLREINMLMLSDEPTDEEINQIAFQAVMMRSRYLQKEGKHHGKENQ